MAYYAISHTYGATTGDENGGHIGTVYRFRTAAQRDEWIKGGSDYLSQRDYREALKNANAVDRRAIRYALLRGDIEEG